MRYVHITLKYSFSFNFHLFFIFNIFKCASLDEVSKMILCVDFRIRCSMEWSILFPLRYWVRYFVALKILTQRSFKWLLRQ